MQVTETQENGLQRAFSIVVPAAEVTAKIEGRLADMAKSVRLPGFRPGKVPMEMMRRKYGPSIMGEILEATVNETSQQALDDRGLRPAMQPKIEVTSFENGKDLVYSLEVEIIPDFELADLGSIEVERLKAEIADTEIDEALERVASQNKSYVTASGNRKSQSGDQVVIDYLGRIDGVAFEGGSAEDASLDLGSGTFIPGFEDQLIGVKSGDEVKVKVTFPAEYGASELAGKAAVFDVKVKEIKEAGATTIDDALAQKLGLENLVALRAAVRDQISREYDEATRARLKRTLLDRLADLADFEVPPGLATTEFDAIWKKVEEDREKGTLDEEDAAKSDEDLKADYRLIAERRVRLGLMLSEIGRVNNVTIEEADLQRAMLQEARRYPGQERQVLEFFQKNQEAMNSLRGPLFEEKVIDFILEMAKTTDRSVPAAEFRDIVTSEAEARGASAQKASAKKAPAKKASAKKDPAKKATKKKAPPAKA